MRRSITTILLNLAIPIALAVMSLGLSDTWAADLEVMTGGKIVPDGGSWYIPMNSSSSKVALFSEQREAFSIYNKTAEPIIVKSIVLIKDEDVEEEEYTLQNADLKPKRLDFKETSVDPKKSFDFYIRLYPVQSKELGATVTIEYGDGKKYTFTVKGKGRSKAIFTENFVDSVHRLFGGQNTDEMVTGMALDKNGNAYFAGQATGLKDKFAYDIFYGRINPDGSLAWAKLWNGPYRDYTRDPGQNDETGGSANAIDVDDEGFVYITGSISPSSYNNNFSALILKIDPSNGDIVWEQMWRPDWPDAILAKHSAEAYALDVHAGHVYVVGTTGAGIANSDALVFLLSLSTQDGSIEFQRYVDPTPKTNDRAYCVKADGKGNVYIGGLAAKVSLLIKFVDTDTNAPKVAWVKTPETGWGSNINCLDTDAEGNVYTSIDRRGATTHLSFLKLDPDGNLVWGKTYDGGSNKNNNCNVIKVAGDNVYVGGRTGQSWYDAQMGDGKLIMVSTKDGTEKWSSFYFTGKGPDEMGEHRIKGIGVHNNKLYVLGQVYTSVHNGYRYWGYWYDGTSSLSDYKPAVKDLGMGEGSGKDIPNGKVKSASGQREVIDLKETVPWQDASIKKDGVGPDSDLIYWQLELK